MCFCLIQGLIRGKPVVNVQGGSIGNNVPGDSPGNLHSVESFTVRKPLNLVGLRFVIFQNTQRPSELVDRVFTLPGTPGVRREPGGTQVEAHRTVASALNSAVGGFQEHTKISVSQKLTVVANEPRHAGKFAGDFLMVVEHVGEVVVGIVLAQFCRQFELHRNAALHIGGTAPVENPVPVIFNNACGYGSERSLNRGQGHGIQVTSQQNARTFLTVAGAKFGTGYHSVTIAGEMQMRICAESLIDGVCNSFFFPGDRINIKERAGEFGHRNVQIKRSGHQGVFRGCATVFVFNPSISTRGRPRVFPIRRPIAHL